MTSFQKTIMYTPACLSNRWPLLRRWQSQGEQIVLWYMVIWLRKFHISSMARSKTECTSSLRKRQLSFCSDTKIHKDAPWRFGSNGLFTNIQPVSKREFFLDTYDSGCVSRLRDSKIQFFVSTSLYQNKPFLKDLEGHLPWRSTAICNLISKTSRCPGV